MEALHSFPCLKCQHPQKLSEFMIRRGGSTICENCGCKLEFKPEKPDVGHTAVVRVTTPNGTYKDFSITVRADGVWQFGDENERAVAEQLDQDSDRAVALIAGSMVETRLRTAILTRCKHVPTIEERHFHPSGAFGSFSVAIDLALMFRIITRDAYDDLRTLKNIRNAFAHRLDIKDFQTQWIADRCKNLALIETHVGIFKSGIGSKIASFDINEKPRIYVWDYNDRLKIPRERFLMTAQLFMVCFFAGDLEDFPIPLI